MAFKKVMEMRKSGNQSEAYEMALNDFQQAPEDVWAKRALSWCYFDCLKASSSIERKEDFMAALQEVKNLGIPSDEELFWNNAIWPICAFVRDCSKSDGHEDLLTTVFDTIKDFPFVKPSEGYSALLKAFLTAKKWDKLVEFCDWWGVGNFREKDFECDTLPSGKKMPISLAESMYLAYAKGLMAKQDKEAIQAFIPQLLELGEHYPKMQYPAYYAGKLLLATGNDKQEAFSTLIPFVRKKQSEFWAWQLLAEAVEKDNHDLYLACLWRAVQCKTKNEFLVRIRLKLIEELANRKAYYHETQQLRLYCKTKLAANPNWQPSADIRHYLQQLSSQYKPDQPEPFPIDYMTLTNDVLYGDISEQVCVVSFVNSDKQIINVVYGKEKEGFFKYESSLCPQIGMKLFIRIQEISKDGFMKVFSARECPEYKEELEYYKEVEGNVIYDIKKDIYSMKSGDIICFIPHHEIKQKSLIKNQTIKASILYTYNKKKEKWMWKIVKLEV